MDENFGNEEAITIDLGKVFTILKKNLRLILVAAISCGLLAFLITTFVLPKKYASESKIYLVPKINAKTGEIDSNAVSTNSKQVNNYMVMLKGENILSKVANKLTLENVDEVKNAISVSNTPDTEIIEVKATTDDPVKSQKIVKETISIFFSEMKTNLKIANMTVLNDAKVNDVPVSPNKKLNLFIGVLLGVFGSCGFIFLKCMLDKRLQTKIEAENFLGIPVLAEIPYYED